MDKYTVTLSLLLVASILFNIFFFVIQNRFEIFKSLIPEISSLKSLLSNSTTNLDKIIQENRDLTNQIEYLKDNKNTLLTVKKGDRIIFREDLTNKTQSHSFSVSVGTSSSNCP